MKGGVTWPKSNPAPLATLLLRAWSESKTSGKFFAVVVAPLRMGALPSYFRHNPQQTFTRIIAILFAIRQNNPLDLRVH